MSISNTVEVEESKKSSTSKIFIDHLDKMKPLKFLQLVQKLSNDYNGILSKDKVGLTEKIDGSALRIGQDKHGTSFIESSTSPPTFTPGDFTARALAKGYTDSIGKHFDQILNSVKKDKKIQRILTKFNDGRGIKIIGEILYIPLGINEGTKVKFIRISYDKDKLGTEWTFIPFTVVLMDGTPHPEQDLVKEELYKISSSERKYVKPTLKLTCDIDLSVDLSNLYDSITLSYENLETILTSRKKADYFTKKTITDKILEFQQMISKKILNHVETGLFGKDLEGLVLNLDDGTSLKIVTEQFKQTEFKTK